MSTRTEELEREAESSRASIDHTLDALRERMSVGDFVDEAGRYVRESGGADMFARLGEQVRANPVPLALVGVGIAWLMSGRGQPDVGSYMRGGRDAFGRWYEDEFGRGEPDELRSTGAYPLPTGPQEPGLTDRMRGRASDMGNSASGAAHRAGDAASSAAGRAQGYAHSAYDGARNTASELAAAAERYAREGSEAARHAYAAARRRADAAWRSGAGAYDSTAQYGARARDGLVDAMEREPLIFGALGLAIGAGIGALLPSTRTEDRWLGPARDSLRDEAMEAGREQFEKARTVAEKTYESARHEAEDQGLLPGSDRPVADRLRDVADKAGDTAREEAEKQNLGRNQGRT